jgi:MFS family permease
MSSVARPALIHAPPARRHVVAALLGNGLEFYDFLTYSFFALQIGRAFFPSQNPLSSLLLALATFGAGFLTRPVGAWAIGRYADRVGRRPAMMLSFFLMGVAILGIAFTPAYSAIGVAAPIMVVLWRLLQGFALGGEVGPSTAFLTEAAPAAQRGLYASFQIATQGVAILAAGIAGVVLAAVFDAAALDTFGWRWAFVLGAVVVPLGLFVRRSLPETLHDTTSTEVIQSEPSRRAVIVTALLGLAILVSNTIATYVRTYMTTYAVQTLHYSSHVAFVTTAIHGITMFLAGAGGGWLSDRFGRKPVMLWSSVTLAIVTLPIFLVITQYRTPVTLYVGMFLLATFGCLCIGPAIVMVSESLPRRLRAGGVGTVYAVATTVFGGTTQFMVAWLIGITGNALVPGWYSVVATVLGLAAILAVRETAPGASPAARRVA